MVVPLAFTLTNGQEIATRDPTWPAMAPCRAAWLARGSKGHEPKRNTGNDSPQVLADTADTYAAGDRDSGPVETSQGLS